MTEKTCPYEEHVRAALAREGLDSGLSAHAKSCPVCREVMALSGWMRRFRDATLEEGAAAARIPCARDIRERARRSEAAIRIDIPAILKPLRVYQWIAPPIAVGAGTVVVVLNAASIKSFLLSMLGIRAFVSGFGSSSAGLSPASLEFFGVLAGLGLLTVVILAAATGIKQFNR